MKKKLALIFAGVLLVVNTTSPFCGMLTCSGTAATYTCSMGMSGVEFARYCDDLCEALVKDK